MNEKISECIKEQIGFLKKMQMELSSNNDIESIQLKVGLSREIRNYIELIISRQLLGHE